MSPRRTTTLGTGRAWFVFFGTQTAIRRGKHREQVAQQFRADLLAERGIHLAPDEVRVRLVRTDDRPWVEAAADLAFLAEYERALGP